MLFNLRNTGNSAVHSFVLLFILVLMPLTALAQVFPSADLEELTEMMKKVPNASSVQRVPSNGNGGADRAEEDADREQKSSKVKFPGAQELLTRSDVSFIDPERYLLGPGDNLKLTLYGRVQEEKLVTVEPEGSIFFDPLGRIPVQGLTLRKARERISCFLSRYYREFSLNLQIVKLRTIEVRILGEVVNPGTYVVSPVIGACDALGLAGGLKDGASLRNVVLTDRKSRKKQRIDLFRWYYMGRTDQNRLLSANYEIFVPLMQNKVNCDGAFRRTGYIEFIPGEKISDMVKMAEPETGSVLSSARLTRIEGKDSLKVLPVDLNRIMDPASPEDLALADGDELFIPELTVFLKKIRVIGELNGANLFTRTVNKLTGQTEIQKMGLYNLRQGERVKDVVIALGGITSKADAEKARVERPLPGGEVKVFPVNVQKLMTGQGGEQNITLQEGDTLIVPSMPDTVYMLGEISSPGAYQYNVGNKVKEYVALAGGPTRRAKLRHVRIIREKAGRIDVATMDLRSVLTGNRMEEVELRPGDVIYIPSADIVSWKDVITVMTDLIVLRQIFK